MKKTTRLVVIVMLVLSFALPVAVLIFTSTRLNRKTLDEGTTLNVSGEEILLPSEVLNNKSRYSGKDLVIRGKVVAEEVACEKGAGCPETRDLILVDSDTTILSQKTKSRLRLIDQDKNQLCQKRESADSYLCGDWEIGQVYDVAGNFYSEAPIAGIAMSLSFYYQVNSKALVPGQGDDRLGNLISSLKSLFNGLFDKPSYYFVK